MSYEYFDTGNDPRIKFCVSVLQNSIKLLKSKRIGELRRQNFEEQFNTLSQFLNPIRYSYLPKKELVGSETFTSLEKNARDLLDKLMENYKNLVKTNEYTIKWLRFVLRNILSLKNRLLSYPDKPSSAVEYYFVKILSVIKHPKADKLWLTSVSDNQEKFDIITNDSSVKVGEIVLLSFLPPRDFSGIVSEGMFLGPNGIRRGAETDIKKSPTLEPNEEKKIVSMIYEFLK